MTWLNPCEVCIGAIKTVVRKDIANGRTINQQTIKKKVDLIKNDSLTKYVDASKKETLQKIKSLINVKFDYTQWRFDAIIFIIDLKFIYLFKNINFFHI